MMNALIIMSKAPIPGLAKTRLKCILSDDECANLQIAMLKDLFLTTEKLKNHLDIFLFYTPNEYFDLMKKLSPDYIKLYPQQGETIGDRMYNSAEFILQKYDKVLIIGSDVPEITSEVILDSFDKLKRYDIVIGPTYDGGYYLIGLKKIKKQIFNNEIRWGCESVFESTLNYIKECSLSYELVPKCYDIDTKEDLIEFFKRNSKYLMAKNTYKFILSIGGKNGKKFNDK
ncbi:2-phospho-L-lactate guanylyltransferase [Caloramator mitchellensis]|uniref:2-phospho-L-lactate guanylyltransferase n=1 Tax=Caloramator mitchellensis TaxID=908809 RepID=A0A0R3JYZ9_CALMK|nr:TIGR04282 family arsenosugar biosynthesis glycosyltransferase [Caloramator mitchellensis]KRQ85797.1 2-phospho-L-lactate guanylyltransferase [Caloramator mitchellensis]